jgi:hypothetical protein
MVLSPEGSNTAILTRATDLTNTFTSSPLALPPAADFDRAEIVFDGLELDGPSFLGHVFLNNPGAGATTPRSATNGYAGAFYICGFASAATGAAGPTDGGVRGPITKSVIATEAVRRAIGAGGAEVTVTVVPVGQAGGAEPEPLRPERVRIVLSGPG